MMKHYMKPPPQKKKKKRQLLSFLLSFMLAYYDFEVVKSCFLTQTGSSSTNAFTCTISVTCLQHNQ